MCSLLLAMSTYSQTEQNKRALWGSINTQTDSWQKSLQTEDRLKPLLTWRMLPGDDLNKGFDLYRYTSATKKTTKLNTEPITGKTNFRDTSWSSRAGKCKYILKYAGESETIAEYEFPISTVPYISIPLSSTEDIHSGYDYEANDVSIGDLDGDGQYELIVKRLAVKKGFTTESDGEEESSTLDRSLWHTTLWEAYKLDGTMLWRVSSGPNIVLGNSACFAVYDFDGDGKAEMAIRTSEGTTFGDGQQIVGSSGTATDYRDTNNNGHMSKGPEYLSVIDGMTGKELARTDYIKRGLSTDWGDNYFKRAESYRLGVARFAGVGENHSILICRGVYARSVLEAWDYKDGQLTKRWTFDSGKNASDPILGKYVGQGYHSLSVGDVDNDGFDEVVYGACTIDHDGKPLNSCGYGHGDALHLGKFNPDAEGLQIWSCFEASNTGAAFRDAKTGNVIWKYDDGDGDVGRCCVADIDPKSPGCEMWWYHGNAYSPTGKDLGYSDLVANFAIWFTNGRNRNLLDATIIHKQNGATAERAMTGYKFGATSVNGTKNNPCWYGDILGDYREEVVLCDGTKTKELMLFSTWYESDFAMPWLMTDHVYEMSAVNENIGYNQPTHTGYYLGSDGSVEDIQRKALANARLNYTADGSTTTAILSPLKGESEGHLSPRGGWGAYNMFGVKVTSVTAPGLYIINGKKTLCR